MVEDVIMCRRRKRKQQAETNVVDNTIINTDDAATAKVEEEDKAADDASTIQDTDTEKQSTVNLDEQLATMGGSQQAISNIQNVVYQEVKGATEKEKMEIRKRKEQQLQRAIRQRRKSGFQGRRSLITGQSGGRGYS